MRSGMEHERIELITLATDLNTPIGKIKTATGFLKGEGDEMVSQGNTMYRYLDEKEARKYTGNPSRSTFWKWRKMGLKTLRIGGRIVFDPNSLREFIQKGGVEQ